ncbi:NUDIX domain-containing protein [Candidatus Woesearchaeota archaeon]|nr:NUDIX domain-containing protein [Candidatus Woesearchaeota archaeon]
MNNLPLAVAIAALIHDDKILLIKRAKGSYVGFWGLPGGKIEKDEHVSEAAIREIKEETGIRCLFTQHLGFVSEHLTEKNEVIQHFLLHLCQLQPLTSQFVEGREGALAWFALADLPLHREEIIPSDYAMIEKMLLSRGKNYYNCVVEKKGDEHHIVRFD